LLPVRADGEPAPELEFIFRTLLQLRIDVEDLRRQFEEYRRSHPELHAPRYPYALPAQPAEIFPRGAHIEDVHVEEHAHDEDDLEKEHEVVVFRPGMTLRDLEHAAITAALREVAGNRRKAAEMLGMGERTLYRKIREYDIPL
jgi:DNA-binding NtrC family response regulator